MIMDSNFNTFPDSFDDFKFADETPLPNTEQSLHGGYGLEFVSDSLYMDLMHTHDFSPTTEFGVQVPSVDATTEINSPDDQESDPVLKFLNQILLEENMDEKPSMFHDPLTLQAAERSLYDAIGKSYPSSPNAPSPDSFFGSTSENSTTSSSSGGHSVDHLWNVDPGGIRFQAEPSQQSTGSVKSSLTYSHSSVNPTNSFSGSSYSGEIDSSPVTNLVPNIFSDSDSILQFQKGMEEAMKFLPTNNQLIIDLDQYTLPPKSEDDPPMVPVKEEKDDKDNSPSSARGRKHLHRQESELEGQRSRKQSAVFEEEVELSELFDKVLLCDVKGFCSSEKVDVRLPSGVGIKLEQNISQGPGTGKARGKKQSAKTDTVDLRSLLTSCAQAVASDDHRNAYDQLKKIREHASTTGDAYQRLAIIFSNGIEARLAGTGTQMYAALASKRISAIEKLKAYQVYISACPFKSIAMYFAVKMILKTAAKASTLHIVDFGISYGFQWPMLIQLLASRPGGPPKLRITGIEIPQSGFRPAELIEETGRRLSKYCERFKVPFEYQALATNCWASISIEDLKLTQDEVLAVNCQFRFKNLLDETVVEDSPRDATLKLIRKMNPHIFVQGVINGSFNSPFFGTRFREALFYYSSLFDMLDATLPRDDQLRLTFEKEFYGREVVNVIACEGSERVERPETYKQWQFRNIRAGFKPLPLDKGVIEKLKTKVKAGYHKDFVFDEDCNWMLQGWKGRLLYGSSCWVPQ